MGGSPEGEPGALTEQLCDRGRREHPRRLHLSPVKWAGWIRWLSFFPLLKRLQLRCYHSHFHNQQYRKSKEICILLDMGEWLAGIIRLENSCLSFSRGFSPANPKSPSTPATWVHQRRCPLLLPMPWGVTGKQSDWGHGQKPPGHTWPIPQPSFHRALLSHSTFPTQEWKRNTRTSALSLQLSPANVSGGVWKPPDLAIVCWGERGMDWECGISTCKLLYREWINKVLL